MGVDFKETSVNNINRKKYAEGYDRIFGKPKGNKVAAFYNYYKIDGKYYSSVKEIAKAFDKGVNETTYLVQKYKKIDGFQIKLIQSVDKLSENG